MSAGCIATPTYIVGHSPTYIVGHSPTYIVGHSPTYGVDAVMSGVNGPVPKIVQYHL